MNKSISQILIALVALVIPILAVTAPVFADDKGRYQMAIDAEDYVWVLDTKTGLIRFCMMVGNSQAPLCAPRSDASKGGIVGSPSE